MVLIVPSSYPVQGIFYMFAHPSLFKNLICPIFITILWGIAVFIFGFAYLLKLQAHALISVNCPAAVAWIVSIIFVLLEVAVLSLLFYLIILPIYEDSLFDRTLKLRGLRHVLKENEGNDMAKCMRGVGGGLWILLFQILVLVLTFPINLIPILGQFIFVAINGWVLTFGYRFHYDAEIRNITVLQSRREAWARRSEYSQFGSTAFGLQMIPLANLLFAWTNIVGCALWVADEIERDESRLQSEQSSHSLIEPGSQTGTPLPAPYQPGTQYPPQQLQQNQQQYPMKQQSYPPQGPPAGSPYSQQGSVRIPPKDKKQTGLEY
ncbi:hypothetical protein EC957_005272 [Mortierella hygrophila]|uniref:Uncharacterized protein n=1 Tax=Mortierella hygrophila TaxID=979708 RepID=A0A9P6FEE5_9FUNG|nr:hypothetical protein EC957_005272 [Mortierella hygrophila]